MSPETDGVVRITRDEALSQRVDDLLQRQSSMRGQPRAAERRMPWYLRNWLLLGLAGLAGSLVAWAVLEPSFEDLIYLQGPVQQVLGEEDAPSPQGEDSELLARVRLRDATILVPNTVRVIGLDGQRAAAGQLALAPGQEIGVYADSVDTPGGVVGVARYVLTAPRPGGPDGSQNLEALARRSYLAGLFLFSVVAGFVGLAIGSADGLVCRLPRRAALSGLIGLGVGLLGGFLSSLIASVVYTPLNMLASKQMAAGGALAPVGFLLQIVGRATAWTMAGMAMGLGQGVALRSRRLLLFGLLGGTVGGLLGGLIFDPIDLLLLGPDKPSAHWSRLVGLGAIGASVGVMIGVVELLARDAWLRMTEGPLAGKEFLLFKDVLEIGSSPRSDIYLFSDPQVAQRHATLRSVGDEFELEGRQPRDPVLVNGRPSPRARLNHGDQITIGRTSFVFQRRQS